MVMRTPVIDRDHVAPMSYAPTARIDLDALRHNLAIARTAAPGRKVMAVVKADAYGHGLVPVARALGDVDALAVARLGEAVRLREAGLQTPIVLLEGCQDRAELSEAAACRVIVVAHRADQVAWLEESRLPHPVAVWLKVDTGMHRLGFGPDQVADMHARLSASTNVHGPVGLMTHLANADDRWDATTTDQVECLRDLAGGLRGPISVANSAGILGWPDSHGDWIRPGLMLYGASPFLNGNGGDDGLRPVMTLTARLIAIKQLKAGDAVGYGGSWRCSHDTTLGVVGIGYGDGYPREISADTPVRVNGQPSHVVGRVSMDMITVDLSRVRAPRVGDSVTLWGEGVPAETLARAANTIPYTLFCGVQARVRFAYTQTEPVSEERHA